MSIDAEFLKEPDPDGQPDPDGGSHRAAEDAAGDPDFGGDQVSQAGSSLQNPEAAGGGADGVPDTPDDVAEPYVHDTDATRRQG